MIVAVMGPTASGKSELALRLAKDFGGEIVSADSMQLYRGLAVGTAQPTAEERGSVPHHLLGCCDFTEKVDVFRFVALAETAIADIERRGGLPIVAGGTGFYLKALVYGLDDLPGDAGLRARLDAEYDRDDRFDELRRRMRELDPDAELRWRDCRRKLIRALEVKLLAGRSILELQQGKRAPRFPLAAIKLEWDAEALRGRIAARTQSMLDAGWIEEARRAIAAGLPAAPTAHQALGYAIIGEYLAGRLDFDAMRERIVTATWQLARRQRTWFRHQHPEAVAVAMPEKYERIRDLVAKALPPR
jgi:tRNA dimethylallyltransferase